MSIATNQTDRITFGTIETRIESIGSPAITTDRIRESTELKSTENLTSAMQFAITNDPRNTTSLQVSTEEQKNTTTVVGLLVLSAITIAGPFTDAMLNMAVISIIPGTA